MRPTRDLLVRAARMTGYPVKLAWSAHDKGDMGDVRGVVEHHTGTPVNYQKTDDYPTLTVVRDGRPGLRNSLSAYGLGRSGTIYCISEKLSWHAGNAWWGGTADVNGHYLGIEAESDGTLWTPEQADCYPRLTAAILHVFGRGRGDHPRHLEVARPKGRKSDWAGLDDAAFDVAVSRYLNTPAAIGRGATTPQEEDVPLTDSEIDRIGARVATYVRDKAGLAKADQLSAAFNQITAQVGDAKTTLVNALRVLNPGNMTEAEVTALAGQLAQLIPLMSADEIAVELGHRLLDEPAGARA